MNFLSRDRNLELIIRALPNFNIRINIKWSVLFFRILEDDLSFTPDFVLRPGMSM